MFLTEMSHTRTYANVYRVRFFHKHTYKHFLIASFNVFFLWFPLCKHHLRLFRTCIASGFKFLVLCILILPVLTGVRQYCFTLPASINIYYKSSTYHVLNVLNPQYRPWEPNNVIPTFFNLNFIISNVSILLYIYTSSSFNAIHFPSCYTVYNNLFIVSFLWSSGSNLCPIYKCVVIVIGSEGEIVEQISDCCLIVLFFPLMPLDKALIPLVSQPQIWIHQYSRLCGYKSRIRTIVYWIYWKPFQYISQENLFYEVKEYVKSHYCFSCLP